MIKLTLSFVAVACFMLFVAATPSAAMSNPLTKFAACGGSSSYIQLGFEPWYACVTNPSTGRPEIDSLKDIWLIALTVIEDAIKAGGYIAAGFIVWGGFKYLKSNGAADQVTQAREVILNAVIGLVVTLISVAIVEFIVSRLT